MAGMNPTMTILERALHPISASAWMGLRAGPLRVLRRVGAVVWSRRF
jgi:hypothetical protein